MATIARSRVALAWPNGGPGVSTFHWSAGVPSPLDWVNSADQFHDELAQVYRALAPMLPTDLTWAVEDTFDVIDVETGNIVDQPVLSDTTNTGAGSASNLSGNRASQGCFNHYTDLFSGGKRLKGRTFVGPLQGGALDTDGGFTTSGIATYEAAWVAITSGVGPRLAVYHRPTTASPSSGYYADVVVTKLKRLPAVLRSRRD